MARAFRADPERFEALKRQIADIPPFRRGSLVRRFMPCGKPGCRCQASPPELHGPYYQWTRKVHGKTATVRVPPAKAPLFAQWIDNGRRLFKIVTDLERVAWRITERCLRHSQGPDTPPTDRRTPRSPPARPRRSRTG